MNGSSLPVPSWTFLVKSLQSVRLCKRKTSIVRFECRIESLNRVVRINMCWENFRGVQVGKSALECFHSPRLSDTSVSIDTSVLTNAFHTVTDSINLSFRQPITDLLQTIAEHRYYIARRPVYILRPIARSLLTKRARNDLSAHR
jgi:hypothetical protein